MNSNYKIFKYAVDSDFETKIESEVFLAEISDGIFSFEKNRYGGDTLVAGLQDVINMLNTSHKVAILKKNLIITNFKLKGDR